jgi:hypothetical protein
MKRNFKIFGQRTYTAIEQRGAGGWFGPIGGCDVYKYHSKAKPGTEITSYGNREFLGYFESIDEAKTYYPKGIIQ